MTPAGIGHNNPPRDRSFKKRWASAIFDCADKKKPVGAVAMAFRLYHDMDGSGRGIAASDLDIARACGVSDRSVRTFKSWLVASGFVIVIAKGGRGGQTEYRAVIPGEIPQPEKSAGEIGIKPEAISGSPDINRQSFPEIEKELPAKISGQTIQPEKSAGEVRHAHAEENINIYNKNNNLPNLTTSAASARGPETAAELEALSAELLGACNGALDNPVNCLGLASLATPIMWLNEGCDLHQDILPTLRGYGKSANGKRIRSWNYFTDGIRRARDTRRAGLPPASEARHSGLPDQDAQMRRIDAIVRGGR